MKGTIKGAAAGFAAGAAMGMVGGLMLKKKPKMNSIKKSAGKALHAAGNFVENMPKW
ncbi:MAG: hypothetical protein IJL83_00865 [Clostridia bacterium]|jgi:hypothetical protein|nr:hypothetical protein [Clostridia bacterium]MBQ6552161.1 hypothetical protein [Clostridia bacterium]